jgi:hypothetical protein
LLIRLRGGIGRRRLLCLRLRELDSVFACLVLACPVLACPVLARIFQREGGAIGRNRRGHRLRCRKAAQREEADEPDRV